MASSPALTITILVMAQYPGKTLQDECPDRALRLGSNLDRGVRSVYQQGGVNVMKVADYFYVSEVISCEHCYHRSAILAEHQRHLDQKHGGWVLNLITQLAQEKAMAAFLRLARPGTDSASSRSRGGGAEHHPRTLLMNDG